MTVRGREIRRISALLLLSLLSAAFLAGCLGASQADRSAKASAGTGSGSPGAVSYTHLTLPTNREV